MTISNETKNIQIVEKYASVKELKYEAYYLDI